MVHDVIIAGAGMVGATLACALGRQSFKVALLEARAPEPYAAHGDVGLRVSAINPRSESILRALGVWPTISRGRHSPFREMQVWDAGGGGEIHFDCRDIGEARLGYIVENQLIQTALIECLQEMPTVDCRWPARVAAVDVDKNAVAAQLEDGGELTAKLVVGADGPGSRVRECAGISQKVREYFQKAVVANVVTSRSHEHTAWQRFLPTGPVAFLPLADGRSSVVWSTDQQHADELLNMSDDDFCTALSAAIAHRLGDVEAASPRAAFGLRGAQVDAYVRPRIALVGDAAHIIHPLAGQGANLGFQDAASLAGVLMREGRDIGGMRVLRQYERERKGDNFAMMRAMEAFKYLFENTHAARRWLRNTGLTMVNAATPLKQLLMRRAMGLSEHA
ncbi:MAG: UbiH/UbiF/VisC/COQ6 family ubiquinone biosynthesis hydroxylase [Gammaproteobacteria bacterium]